MAKLVPIRRVYGNVEDLSDEALVAACATGDRAALGALFDRHNERVQRFAARILGPSTPEVDDVVQLTFETVRRTAPKSRRFGGAHLDHRHRARTEPTGRARGRAGRRPTAGGCLPHRAAAAAVMAVDGLLPKLREVFVLAYVEGMPGREVAEALGIRESTVWKRLNVARRKQREAMGGSK